MAKKESQAIYMVKDDQHKKLKLLSFKLSRSMSDLVRESLGDLFNKPDMKKILDENLTKTDSEGHSASDIKHE